MPSPVWSYEGDRFSKLVNELSAEHARVIDERNQLRHFCAKSRLSPPDFVEGSAADRFLRFCARRAEGDDVPVEDTNEPPPPLPLIVTGHEAPREAVTSPVHSRRAMSKESTCSLAELVRPTRSMALEQFRDELGDEPQTPRELREMRGDAQLPPDGLTVECGKSHAHEGEALELHTRWLDLYVANQLKGDINLANDRKGSTTDLGVMLKQRGAQGTHPRELLTTSERAEGWIRRKRNANVPIMPGTKFRVSWDTFGVPIILYDVILIPVQLAWDLEPNLDLIKAMLVYWVTDILINFNTAYTFQGQVIAKRSSVAMRYLRRRFWLDLFLVLIDIVVVSNPSNFPDVSWYRALRAFRVLRILRALKLSKMQETLEELFVDTGIERMLLGFAISQTLISIFLVAHMLSCGWYYLGRAQISTGSTSWLTSLEASAADTDDLFEAYINCMYWTLGHVVGGNVNPDIRPVTFAERIYTVSMVAISLLVVGAGISKMTNTIADLQRVNVEAKDTRRKLSQVLRASNADADLSARILRFGMHLFRRKASLSLEDSVMGLLSQALASELTLSQRSRYLGDNPLFEVIRDEFSDVYLQLCGAFNSHIYADSDVIFREGTVAECLYVTVRGEYILDTSYAFLNRLPPEAAKSSCNLGHLESCDPSIHGKAVKFSNIRWLCEIALFTTVIHKNGLRTTSFADAFTLKGDDFATCVERSPRCITKVYHYASEFISQLTRLPSMMAGDSGPEEFDYEVIPRYFSKKICDKIEGNTPSAEISDDLDSPMTDQTRAGRFMDNIMDGTFTSPDDLLEEIAEVFGELQTHSGIYEGLKMEAERKRSVAAITSVIWLVQGNYEAFTMAQPNPRTKLSTDVWEDMQRLVRWAGVTKDTLRAILVFLAIRGIGKAAPFLQAMQRDCRTPEDVVLTLMRQLPRKVPSYDALSYREKVVLEKALHIHRGFNLGQMLQGENAPYHIAVLQHMVQTEGLEVLKFYLVSLVGVMCGLRGVENPRGSLFMDQVNGSTLMACVRMVERLDSLSANAIYWGYIGERARMLNIPFKHLEDFAIARLACLARAKLSDVGALQTEWYRLNRGDREVLIQHFVADGLYKATYVFDFLPSYIVSARQNRSVGVYRALMVLVELIDTLTGEGYLDRGTRVITVNLQDLADFTQKVESSGAFMAVHVHSSLVSRHNRLDFIVSAKHKQYTTHQNWSDDPTHEMRALMRRMDRRVGCVNRELERLAKSSTPKVLPELALH